MGRLHDMYRMTVQWSGVAVVADVVADRGRAVAVVEVEMEGDAVQALF